MEQNDYLKFSEDGKTVIHCDVDYCDLVVIPEGVTSIEDGAFSGCTDLTSIVIPNSVTKIGDWAFSDSGIKKIIVAEDNPNYRVIEGVMYLKDKTKLLFVPNTIDGHFIIPNSVTEIGNGAFSGCTDLTSIKIPNSVT